MELTGKVLGMFTQVYHTLTLAVPYIGYIWGERGQDCAQRPFRMYLAVLVNLGLFS